MDDISEWMTAGEALAWTLVRSEEFSERMRFSGHLSLVRAARQVRDLWRMPIDAVAKTLSHECEQGSVAATGYPRENPYSTSIDRCLVPLEEWKHRYINTAFDYKLIRTPDQKIEWSDLEFNRANIIKIFPPKTYKSSKIGRPAAIQWDLVQKEAENILEERGDFAVPGDKEWDAQARLEEMMKIYIEKRFGMSLADSTVRERVSGFVTAWRSKRLAGNSAGN